MKKIITGVLAAALAVLLSLNTPAAHGSSAAHGGYSDASRTGAYGVGITHTANPSWSAGSTQPLPAETIFKRSADAVFMIETFDEYGESIRTGSGFFISSEGYAVTCLHVIENAARAVITLYNGEEYPMRGVHAMSEENNLIIFSIVSNNNQWSYLSLADSDRIEVGNTVYALGSPLGLINTLTEGIVSTKSRELDGNKFIQFTAPISFGSGGSALLNTLGQVIGVASSSFSYGQNLNLAIPVNYVKELKPGECITLKEILKAA